ncbi:hypothetical protein P3T76_014406 [Phytophthora citrophthora]|uniref:Uncharacterized protein n=1 Tax=Phytophthora citrophthora TaxID=4793 RepID=A0AAD9LB85_9STRA|nr:hypothetical protein P3T76_014406 [Phytophthora citrophthora]
MQQRPTMMTELQTQAMARVNAVIAGMKRNEEERDDERAAIYVATVRPGMSTAKHTITEVDEVTLETTNDQSKNNNKAVILRETNKPSQRTGESATKKSTSDESDCAHDEQAQPNNAQYDGNIKQVEPASVPVDGPECAVALDDNTTAQTATTEPQENGTLETGEGVKIPAPDSDEKTAARRRLTAQRRLMRRAARKDARQRRQAKIRAERGLAEQAKTEQTRIDLGVRLSRIKGAVDGLQALSKRRERRKVEPEANEGEDRSKPVPVKLVKHIREDAERSSTSDNGNETTVSSEDGLPTAKVLVNNIWHGIKLDSCARYTIAGTDWMKHGDRMEGDAPIDYVEGIGGFLLDVVGMWRFQFKTVFGETVYADACIVDGCTSDFLLGVDFLRQHGATMDFERNELSYRDDDRKVIIPFHTTEGAKNEANGARVAAVRMTKRTQLQGSTVTSVEVAVAAPDGETNGCCDVERHGDDGAERQSVGANGELSERKSEATIEERSRHMDTSG